MAWLRLIKGRQLGRLKGVWMTQPLPWKGPHPNSSPFQILLRHIRFFLTRAASEITNTERLHLVENITACGDKRLFFFGWENHGGFVPLFFALGVSLVWFNCFCYWFFPTHCYGLFFLFFSLIHSILLLILTFFTSSVFFFKAPVVFPGVGKQLCDHWPWRTPSFDWQNCKLKDTVTEHDGKILRNCWILSSEKIVTLILCKQILPLHASI